MSADTRTLYGHCPKCGTECVDTEWRDTDNWYVHALQFDCKCGQVFVEIWEAEPARTVIYDENDDAVVVRQHQVNVQLMQEALERIASAVCSCDYGESPCEACIAIAALEGREAGSDEEEDEQEEA